jgi:predicted glycosyltransferase
MRNVVFLVKNGIGFGHLRRALILAEALLDAGQVRPVIISQASSLAIFQGTRVPVVNFPLLHRVPSAVAEDWYTEVLDALLDQLDPAVVIEDTYPDQRYAGLTSLMDRPRLLVLRRLDHASFDTIRATGAFARYDEILIVQDQEGFGREGHSDVTLTAVHASGRFQFVGPVYRAPTADEVEKLRAEYAPDGSPLVVVNGGAGGDQMPDGYGDRLFHSCQQMAAALAGDGTRVRFVFVTGPYYAGRPLETRANVTVRRFEPHLHALLAAAHVAVIKPGTNALSEALSGRAHLVLVPDVSFMEGLSEHAERIVAEYGGQVAAADAEVLKPLVRAALSQQPRLRRFDQPPTEGIAKITAAICRHAATGTVSLDPYRLLLLIKQPVEIPTSLQGAMIIDGDPAGWSDLTAQASVVRVDLRRPERLQRRLRAVFRQAPTACVALDVPDLGAPRELQAYLHGLGAWLTSQRVQLMSASSYRALLARRPLEKR